MGIEGLRVDLLEGLGGRAFHPADPFFEGIGLQQAFADITDAPVQGFGQMHHQVQLGVAGTRYQLGGVSTECCGELLAIPPAVDLS